MSKDLYNTGSTLCAQTGEECYIAEAGATCATVAPALAKTIGIEIAAPVAGEDGVVPEAQRGCVRLLGLVAEGGVQ